MSLERMVQKLMDERGTRDRVTLRRMTLEGPLPRAALRLLCEEVEGWERNEPAWRTILAGLGMGHGRGRRFGQALAEAGYSEGRLDALLSARDRTLDLLTLRALRFLQTQGVAVEMGSVAALLLTRDAAKKEACRRGLAADYFRHCGE